MPIIESHPDILGGEPCIAGTRISVAFILELVASGATRAEVMRKYRQVTIEGFDAALRYAASAVSRDQLWDLPVTA